jgi:glycosyltransferase involved in cell wall biosynthesis
MKPYKNEGCIIGVLAGSSYEIGGVENHIISLCSTLKRFHFVVFGPFNFIGTLTSLKLANVETAEWSLGTPWDVFAALHLLRMLWFYKPALLHIHDPRSGAVGRMIAKVLNIPVVYTVHLPSYYYVTGLKQRLYQLIERLLNKGFTDRIIYVSHSAYDEAIRDRIASKQQSLVIENGIDLRAYTKPVDCAAVRKALNVPVEVAVFCFVGRFTEQKGIDVLLHAVTEIQNQHTVFRVWLVGDGPLRAELEEWVAKENLSSIVQFLGYRSDIPAILQASDVFVLPSRYEAMPISLLEAMAAGLPCVVTNVGDNAKVVEDGITGIVVPPENPEALATALRKMLAEPEMRRAMGEAARKKAQQYSVERMAARIAEVYEELLMRP